jgi:hypothetical protein
MIFKSETLLDFLEIFDALAELDGNILLEFVHLLHKTSVDLDHVENFLSQLGVEHGNNRLDIMNWSNWSNRSEHIDIVWCMNISGSYMDSLGDIISQKHIGNAFIHDWIGEMRHMSHMGHNCQRRSMAALTFLLTSFCTVMNIM